MHDCVLSCACISRGSWLKRLFLMAGAGNRFPALLPKETQAIASNIIPEDQRIAAAAAKPKVQAKTNASKAKAKAPAKPKVQAKEKAKEKANAIRVVESEAKSRVDGQTWKTFILRQGKTCLAHVSARKIGEVAAQSLVKMLKEKAENGEDKVALAHFKEIQMLRMKGL